MKYFDAFSGYGGFSLGIQRAYENKRMVDTTRQMDSVSGGQQKEHGAGVGDTHGAGSGVRSDKIIPTCIGFSEIDKYAIQVYSKHFPTHKNYGNITAIHASTLPDFDLFVGGVPCQSWSIAGKRGGFEDPRGNMWFESIKIIREKKPKYFLLENVKGLLSHDGGKSMERICEELCGCGYAIDFEVLNAKNFGVPQNRERVFIIGFRLDLLDECQIF